MLFIISIFIFFIAMYLLLIMPNLFRHKAMKPFLNRDYAHRGLHDEQRLIPENSMAAFREALRENLAIELDIHLTRDNHVVVFHDESLERICHVSGTIEEASYEDLKSLHLQGTSEKIPLFSEVLSYVNGRVPLLIELKLPTSDTRLCSYTLKLLRNYNGPYMIQSFNSLGVRWFFKNAPDILRGQLSSSLTKTNPENPYIVRFCVQHLLTNFLCQPDFISYKMADSANLSVWINKYIYHIPVAVWTLRSNQAYHKAKEKFDMYIFEGFSKKI
ncbi:MAG: glycerophosphodiester phosphodiesterase family protein [Bariatricus sp.]|nr:glycerophosphodiester phosphodiesterase family protein [Bariatricus sp.]